MFRYRWLIKSRQVVWHQLKRSRQSCSRCMITLMWLSLVLTIVILSLQKFVERNNDPLAITNRFMFFESRNSFFRWDHNKNGEKKDWHDHAFVEQEKRRIGPGEQGRPVLSVEKEEEELNLKLFNENGYYGLISDKISLNRSVADIRHSDCKSRLYLADLPTVSIVIPFFNDHLSTLLRSVYSVINRSPASLLHEVILVNDHSTKDFLYDPLQNHIDLHLKGKVRIINLPVRSGLIWARLAGARAASGDVLIFLDSHVEANTNWLPPLLEPIARNYRTCVCPLIDVIDFKTYAYQAQDEGSRGVFDWYFSYHKIAIRPGDQESPSDLYPSPIMAGGLFAISAKFFWELGGYDTGLDIWGGEQYELSFKIWLCGGQMFDAPCSRIAHIFRGSMPFPNARPGVDFVSRNYKRVAEAWMDEYKEFIYLRNPERFKKVDAGDLSEQIAIKKNMKCKSFKFFMEEVAPDMLERYPYVDPESFAEGSIESLASPGFCVDTYNREKGLPVQLYPCAANRTHPQYSQHFFLRYFRDVAIFDKSSCWDSIGDLENNVTMYACHNGQGNQYFRYDLETKMMHHGTVRRGHCVDSNPKSKTIFINKCQEGKISQQWKWAKVNETMLKDQVKMGAKYLDDNEFEDLS